MDGAPVADPAAAAARLQIAERAGCDRAPIDATTHAGRLSCSPTSGPTSPSGSRASRRRRRSPCATPSPSSAAARRRGCSSGSTSRGPALLTVVWQSVVNQYLDEGERDAIRSAFASAAGGPFAWLTLEPPARRRRRGRRFELRCRERPEDNGSGVARLLAHRLPRTAGRLAAAGPSDSASRLASPRRRDRSSAATRASGSSPARDVGERHLLEHAAQARADRDPDLPQRLGAAAELELLRTPAADARRAARRSRG